MATLINSLLVESMPGSLYIDYNCVSSFTFQRQLVLDFVRTISCIDQGYTIEEIMLQRAYCRLYVAARYNTKAWSK